MPRAKRWSYSTGERGVNRVRAYEDATRGVIFLEWYERVEGRKDPKRERVSTGHADRARATAAAEQLAAKLRAQPARREVSHDVTLHELFDNYLREVTPSKGASKQAHDHRAAQLFMRCFGGDVLARNLSRREWDRFIRERRSGELAPLPPASGRWARRAARDLAAGRPRHRRTRPVRDRVIGYDLRWLLAVLNWATRASDGFGGALLDRNPLKGLPVPRDDSPRRPVLSSEQYAALLTVAPEVSPAFELAVILAHETGHRIGAIRQVRWADVDLARGTVLWRAQSDKCGFEHRGILTDAAIAALRRVQDSARVPSEWVFPSPRDPKLPCSRQLLRKWWDRGAALAQLPAGQRLGWHAFRRMFATELKATPLRDLCYLGGWKSPQTVLTCYQHPDEDTMRRALASRGSVQRVVSA